jgi:hypothetical protein
MRDVVAGHRVSPAVFNVTIAVFTPASTASNVRLTRKHAYVGARQMHRPRYPGATDPSPVIAMTITWN